MAKTIAKSGSIAGTFNKVGAATSALRTPGDYTRTIDQWLSGESTNFGYGNGSNTMIAMLYGADFRTLQNLDNVQVTGFTLSLYCGGWNTTNFLLRGSTSLKFQTVTGFDVSASTDTSTFTDLGDGEITLASGTTSPTTFTRTHSDLPNTLTWINNNLAKFISGYDSNGFGIRFYMKFGQFRSGTLALDYTYTVPAYTLTVNAGTGGTVTGGGDYEAGTTATIKATPNTGYKFVKWVNASGATVSTNATYSLSVTADTTLTAVFEKLTYTITFKNEDGTILQASSVAYGDTPSYTGATPTKASTAEYSYSFSGWSPSIAAVTGAATYTAKFTATKRSYAITVSAGEGGTASGGNTYPYGSTVQISATAKEGWEFRGWSDGNTDNPRTITVTGAATYTAVFEEKAPLPEMLDFKIINPRNNMQVTIDNPLEAGQEYLIELTANQ